MSLSSVEAARRLGVSDRQVRRLVQGGVLRSRRVAGRLLLDADEVERRAMTTPGRGRPFAARAAWGVLWTLSGERAGWLSSSERSRLRVWLRKATPESLMLATRSRARVERYRVLARYLGELSRDRDVIRGGVSAAAEAGADIVVAADAEIYCADDALRRIIGEYGLSSTGEPNVVVRVPAVNLGWLGVGRAVMPHGVVAVDLMDSQDLRTRRAGGQLASSLLERIG